LCAPVACLHRRRPLGRDDTAGRRVTLQSKLALRPICVRRQGRGTNGHQGSRVPGMDVLTQQLPVFVQQLINGLTLGSIYGLIAIGYTMVFGIIGMINFAHGDVFMVSSFIGLVAFLILTAWIGLSSIVLALLIVLIV